MAEDDAVHSSLLEEVEASALMHFRCLTGLLGSGLRVFGSSHPAGM